MPHGRPTVLVLDDDAAIRELIREVLAEEGYRVVEAAHGDEALAHLRNDEQPAVLLVDVLMSRVDGWEFVNAVRADPRTRELPVIVMSSSIPPVRLPSRVSFLLKPFKLQELLAAVRSVRS